MHVDEFFCYVYFGRSSLHVRLHMAQGEPHVTGQKKATCNKTVVKDF